MLFSNSNSTRRAFLRDAGLKTAALPFLFNLPSLGFANQTRRKQRMVVIFTPNGIIPDSFWPEKEGSFVGWENPPAIKEILEPFEPFKDQLLTLQGVSDKVKGDGDGHMRGIGCLLTGIELFPGNIQGGSDTPAGWSSGISIDQEIRNFLQKDDATKTRFGSLEYGVLVPERADTWTRMVYAGPNKPIAPINDPYQVFAKLYGRTKDRETLGSVLDILKEDLEKLKAKVSTEDGRLIDEHATFVREMEKELKNDQNKGLRHKVPELEPGIREDNINMPKLTRMQIDLMVQGFAADFNRIATLQFTNSVGMARMKWLGIDEGHHELSHEPDSNFKAKRKLIKINRWFSEQIAYLAKKLSETPEPGGGGSLLDNTTIIWTNELGKGNSHTLDNIPFVMIGGGLGFKTGRALKYPRVPHNRLLLSIAHGFGHHIDRFGKVEYCKEGPLSGLV